jgi:putative endonuclease
MRSNRRSKGRAAEDFAENFLTDLGYKRVLKNYTVKGGEIDLIMKDHEFFVFVEVKSLRQGSSFSIYESLSSKKKRRLRFAINKWLIKNHFLNALWRLDFIGITSDNVNNFSSVEHFQFVSLN